MERAVRDSSARAGIERRLRFEFQLTAPNYLGSGQLPRTKVDWFACMQHHGAPTRALDFTRSPYVATYFAVEDLKEGETGQIWAIDETWFGRHCERILAAGDAADANRLVAWLYGPESDWSAHSMVAPAGLMQPNPRQIAQQAVCLVPGDVSLSFEDNLRAMATDENDLSNGVTRYLVSYDEQGLIMRDLRLMNITRASLFPGIDGFAQSLKYSLIDESWEQTARRSALDWFSWAMDRPVAMGDRPPEDEAGPK